MFQYCVSFYGGRSLGIDSLSRFRSLVAILVGVHVVQASLEIIGLYHWTIHDLMGLLSMSLG